MPHKVKVGDIVELEGITDEPIPGRVREIYGTSKQYVVVDLTPELSGEYRFPEPETLSWPLDKVRPVSPPAA